jgi:hypothetical protein
VYVILSTDEGKDAIYLGSLDAKPEQQSSTPLLAGSSYAVYAPSADPSTGYLLFMREDTVMAQPFDNRRLELKGQALPVAGQIGDFRAFSASENGLVFQRSNLSLARLTWYDRAGMAVGTVGDPDDYKDYVDLALSPDGTRLAVSKENHVGDLKGIWLMDLSRGAAGIRFTFGPIDTSPVWSPDGSRLIFSSNRDGPFNLYQKPANGAKDEEVLLKTGNDKFPTGWSRDGRLLLYSVVQSKNKSGIWVLPLEGERKPVPFLISEFNEGQARFSPDGHSVAYTSNESGHDEVYVRSFSMNSAGTAIEASGKWLISNGSGVQPRWRGDGRELYYRSRSGGLMGVEIATSPAFRAGNPHPFGLASPGGWDCATDGKRFLGLSAKSGLQPYTVVLNWQAGLKK